MGNVVDIRESLALKKIKGANTRLLVEVLALTSWDFTWGLPYIYGPDDSMGLTPWILADATGFRPQVIMRHAEQEGIELFKGVPRHVTVDEWRAPTTAIDLADIPRLLTRLKPNYLKKPEARRHMERLKELSWDVLSAIGELPQVQDGLLKFFEEQLGARFVDVTPAQQNTATDLLH